MPWWIWLIVIALLILLLIWGIVELIKWLRDKLGLASKKELEQVKEALQDQIDELKKRLKANEDGDHKRDEEIDGLKKENERQDGEIDELKKKQEKMDEELEKMKKIMEELQRMIEKKDGAPDPI